jgi:hypothetical protein
MPRPCSLWCGVIAVFGFLVFSPRAQAKPPVAGTYRCTGVEIGRRQARCTSPPLTLYADGCYRIWGEEGTYRVRGRLLLLSQSKKRGHGRLGPNRQLVFNFTYKGQKHRVTFQREYEALPGSAFI